MENSQTQTPSKSKKIFKILGYVIIGTIILVGFMYQIAIKPIMESSINDYASRSRDASRQVSLNLISTTLMSYYTESDKYPAEISSGCVNIAGLESYLRTTPKENLENHKNDGCNDLNAELAFAYRVFKNEKNEDEYILSATMENEKNGNSAYDIDEIKKNPELLKNLQKGNGKYYIVSSVY